MLDINVAQLTCIALFGVTYLLPTNSTGMSSTLLVSDPKCAAS